MNTPHYYGQGNQERTLSRRTLLCSTMAASAGLASMLLTKTTPAVAQDRELKLLTWSHFVPSSDEELQRQLEEFGKMAGIRVRMDRVAHLQLPAILASEVQGQKGHDITIAGSGNPDLYAKYLRHQLQRNGGGLQVCQGALPGHHGTGRAGLGRPQ